MGQRRYPLLKPREVEEILIARGFVKQRQVGSHAQWECAADGERKRSVVTMDVAKEEFCKDLICSMIRQSNLTQDEFYSATKPAARKAGVVFCAELKKV